jgi:hypothetical protein
LRRTIDQLPPNGERQPCVARPVAATTANQGSSSFKERRFINRRWLWSAVCKPPLLGAALRRDASGLTVRAYVKRWNRRPAECWQIHAL